MQTGWCFTRYSFLSLMSEGWGGSAGIDLLDSD